MTIRHGFPLAAALLTLPLAAPAPADPATRPAADRATVLVLDASGSMWAQLPEGRARIEVAREVLTSYLGTRNPEAPLGVIAYGHNRKGDCSDIEVIAPVGPQDARALGARLQGLMPRGKTPLAGALQMAAAQIPPTAEEADLVLITDGLETCDADPCAVAARLAAEGIPVRAHVVGFGLTEGEIRQIACVAEQTGGLVLSTQSGAELAEALIRTTAAPAAPPPRASLDTPASAPARDTITVRWQLDGAPPAAQPDRLWWRQAGRPDDRGDLAAEIDPAATEARIPTPAQPGSWRLAYTRWPEGGSDYVVLADADIAIEAAEFSVMGPPGVMAGDLFHVDWAGTVQGEDRLVVMPEGADRTNTPISAAAISGDHGTAELSAPITEGRYELRRHVNGPEGISTAASYAFEVIAPEISFETPAEVPPGQPFEFLYRGPTGGDGWIDITDPGNTEVYGSGYLRGGYDYFSALPNERGARRGRLMAPDTPGRYALRVVLSVEDRKPVFWQEFEVVAGAQPAAPPPVPADAPAAPPAYDGDHDPTHGPDETLPAEDIGFRCDQPLQCVFEDPATGLMTIVPAGWFTDFPTRMAATAGGPQDGSGPIRLTFYGPQEIPDTIVLNPHQWLEAHGPCRGVQPGRLCRFEPGSPALEPAWELIRRSIRDTRPRNAPSPAEALAGAMQQLAAEDPAAAAAMGALLGAAQTAEPGQAPDPGALLGAMFGAASGQQAGAEPPVLASCPPDAPCLFSQDAPSVSGLMPAGWSASLAAAGPEGRPALWFIAPGGAGRLGLNQPGGTACLASAMGPLCAFAPGSAPEDAGLIAQWLGPAHQRGTPLAPRDIEMMKTLMEIRR
ncbi:MAG: VWA domain-containing protein [Paracoccaceae bacterium]